MSVDKPTETTRENSSEKSAEGSLDKVELFAKLLRVQYPMSQEAATTKVEEENGSKIGYHERMDSLIKKYEDEL